MNTTIKRVAAVVLGLFGALFINLNIITLLQADDLANHPANRRLMVREYEIARGPIVVGEHAIALSTPTEGELRYLRTYPEGPRYAHLTGYYSLVLQRSGLEAAVNEQLTGRPTEVVAQNLGDLLGTRDRAGNAVVLTIDPRIQAAAEAALGDRQGAIVVLDPQTGAVLASYSNPTFDPNPLSSHDPSAVVRSWDELLARDDNPLVDRALRELYPPGSAFKMIVAAAALEHGMIPTQLFADQPFYDVPQTTADIGNYGGGVCATGQTISLEDAFRLSCNTVFARMGVDLGADALVAQAERFGFNFPVPFELPVVASAIPHDLDVPATAQSAIGQRDVRVTTLHMAMIAAAIVNGGEMMRPHVVDSIRNPEGGRVRGSMGGRWEAPPGDGRAISARTAQQLRRMMVSVVESGTGSRARIPGIEVGGKTGTAQTGLTGTENPPVAWFVGFAGHDVAIAVTVPGNSARDTGGLVAAPIARDVLEVAVATRNASTSGRTSGPSTP
ncbi:MAG: penicillin-binding protein 2 [Nitriliruptoraceae bacterium]